MPQVTNPQAGALGQIGRSTGCGRFRICLLALFCAAASALDAAASDPEFLLQVWNADRGLPDNSVFALAKTADGYLWAGTRKGLVRFDGVRFELFNTNLVPVLGSGLITSLLADRDGQLWIGTSDGGLCHLRGRRFEQAQGFTRRDGWVNAIAEDRVGNLWAGGQGVTCYNPRTSLEKFLTNGLPPADVMQVACDTSNRIWAVAGGKLMRLDGEKWSDVESVLKLNRTVYALAPRREGGLWVSVNFEASAKLRGSRVFALKADDELEELTGYGWPQNTPATHPSLLREDAAGRLWLATVNAGVFWWQRETGWHLVALDRSMDSRIKCLLDEPEGGLWIGAVDGGLQRLTRRLAMSFALPPPSEGQYILTACATHDGAVLAGTDGVGIFRFRDGGVDHFGTEMGLTNLHVAVLLEDKRTNLWAGTWGGLYRLRDGRFQPEPGPDALRRMVLSLFQDRTNNLWVGTENGIVRLNQGAAEMFGPNHGLPQFDVLAIVEDSSAQIWAAIRGHGLFRFHAGHFEKVGGGQWSGETTIRTLFADANGRLWIGTDGQGLFCLKAGKFRQWTTEDGLPDMIIHSILSDAEGKLWMGSDQGIFGCSPEVLEKYQPHRDAPVSFSQLTPMEGLETRVCNGAGQPVSTRTADGRLWFPNRRSLASFQPGTLPEPSQMKPALIEQISVDGRSLEMPETGELQIPSSAQRFELHYTSPNHITPERLRFRYRLVGYQNEWVDAGKQRAAYYGHLAPRKYEFQVMVGSSDNQWSANSRPLPFEITPQFFERDSVRAVLVVLTLGIVSAIVFLVARARYRRRLLLLEIRQTSELERRRIARDLHDDLGAGLTDLMMLAEAVGREKLEPAEVPDRAAQIVERVRILTAATDEIVWTLNPRHDSVRNLIGYLSDFAQSFFQSSAMRCRLDVPEGLPDHQLNANARHNLLLAFKEALNNAIKHSGATEIWFRVRFDPAGITIMVEDNGSGFDALKLTGSGDGLLNIRDRMQSVGGCGKITSQRGKGTAVALFLPLAASP